MASSELVATATTSKWLRQRLSALAISCPAMRSRSAISTSIRLLAKRVTYHLSKAQSLNRVLVILYPRSAKGTEKLPMKKINISVPSEEWQSKYIESFLQLPSVLGPEGGARSLYLRYAT